MSTKANQPPITNHIQELEDVLRERDDAVKEASYLRGERDALEARVSDIERERTAACAELSGAEEGMVMVQKQAEALRTERDGVLASLKEALAERCGVPPDMCPEFLVFQYEQTSITKRMIIQTTHWLLAEIYHELLSE